MYILVGMFLKARHFCPSLYISLSISPLPYRNTGPGPGPSPALAPAFIPLRAESAGRTPQLIVFRHRDREAGLILPAVPERPFTHRESSAFRSVCGVRPGKDTSADCPPLALQSQGANSSLPENRSYPCGHRAGRRPRRYRENYPCVVCSSMAQAPAAAWLSSRASRHARLST